MTTKNGAVRERSSSVSSQAGCSAVETASTKILPLLGFAVLEWHVPVELDAKA
jgi:hypothetical protein